LRLLHDIVSESSSSQESISSFLWVQNAVIINKPDIIKTISLFSLIVIRKGIFEKRLIKKGNDLLDYFEDSNYTISGYIEASKKYLDFQTRDLSLFLKDVNEGKIWVI